MKRITGHFHFWSLNISIFIMAMSGCYLFGGNEGGKINFKNQLGTYVLDVRRTVLGPYCKDSDQYKQLTITFNQDSSFTLNMKVPFLFDSIGSWVAGNTTEWNYLRFKSFPYNKSDEHAGSQFTRPYLEDSAILFLINGATPQNGAQFIQEIYFKKVSAEK
jgi:hypothetical protein